MNQRLPEPVANPTLCWSDAWLLAAIADGQAKDEPVNLAEMIERADWLNRGIPSFAEVSFGLQRLLAVGLITVQHPPQGGLLLRATAVAQRVERAGRANYSNVAAWGLCCRPWEAW